MGWCGSGRCRGQLLPLATPPSPILCFQSTDRGDDRQSWEMREREDSEDAWLQSALACMKVLVAQYCPTLCNSMNCSLPGSFVHGILQVRILDWVAIPFSRGSFPSRDQIQVSCIASRFFTDWATREVPFFCLFVCLFLLFHTAYLLLVPRSGIKTGSMAMTAPSPNHWTTRKLPNHS